MAAIATSEIPRPFTLGTEIQITREQAGIVRATFDRVFVAAMITPSMLLEHWSECVDSVVHLLQGLGIVALEPIRDLAVEFDHFQGVVSLGYRVLRFACRYCHFDHLYTV